jgi:hypothetical protein
MILRTQPMKKVLTQLSHQLCEQLRLILEPTKAAKLLEDFRTGKRLNMRKITSYIASQFKKDNVKKERVGDMYEKRDGMGNINPEDSYDEVNVTKEKVGDMYGETEKRDVMNNIDPEGSYDEVLGYRLIGDGQDLQLGARKTRFTRNLRQGL